MAAAMLVIDNIIVRIAGREILDGASASLPAGRRIGLVGRNGAGKSTLLKVILGELHPDDGDLKSRAAQTVPMTFSEVEKVLRFKLPASAFAYPAWWSNEPAGHVQARAWM